MRKLIITAAFLGCTLAHAQNHVKGKKEILVGAGITGLGLYGEAGFHYNMSSKVKLGANIALEGGNDRGMKYNSFYLSPEVRYAPFNVKGKFFLNLGGGAVGVFNSINVQETSKKNGFNYGLLGLIEPELYLGGKVIIYANFKQYYLFGDVMKSALFMAGGGVKFIF